MEKEEREFLKELQREMLTQDHVCQANPRFWVVMETKRVYGIDGDYADGCVIVGEEGEECNSNLKDVAKWLNDTLDIDCEYTVCQSIEIGEEELHDLDDVINYLENNTGYDQFSIVHFKDEEQIAKNTMFLTNRECKEHIKANYYHYSKDAHSYAMTAWRSPQEQKLYEILEETDWEIS